MTDLQKLLLLVPGDQAQPAPGKIEFASYRDGKLIPASGADHLIWTIAIGANHTATVYMHREDHAELIKLADR